MIKKVVDKEQFSRLGNSYYCNIVYFSKLFIFSTFIFNMFRRN